jgi:hypothetical protein
MLTDTETEETAVLTTVAPKKLETGAFSLKVTLRHTKPPIWRRILMPGRMTLADLHQAIQVTMGWHDAHLHAFDVGGDQYGDPATTDGVANERRLTLNALAKTGTTRFTYTYDFGDDWEHDVLVEKAPPASDAKAFPACVAGKRSGPPEDCGGVLGYDGLRSILADPAHPQHEEMRNWAGEDFDPEAFSVAEADAALAAVFRRTEPLPAVD